MPVLINQLWTCANSDSN